MENKMILSKDVMKKVIGGKVVTQAEYCSQLAMIVSHNDLSEGACQGAQIGAEHAGCKFTVNC